MLETCRSRHQQLVLAGGNRAAVQLRVPVEACRTRIHQARVDDGIQALSDQAETRRRGPGDLVVHCHGSFARHEGDAVDEDATHHQHLVEGLIVEPGDSGRERLSIGLSVGIEHDHLAERLHRAVRLVQDAIRVAEDLEGLDPVGFGERLRQGCFGQLDGSPIVSLSCADETSGQNRSAAATSPGIDGKRLMASRQRMGRTRRICPVARRDASVDAPPGRSDACEPTKLSPGSHDRAPRRPTPP
jgi:hypothetical protein